MAMIGVLRLAFDPTRCSLCFPSTTRKYREHLPSLVSGLFCRRSRTNAKRQFEDKMALRVNSLRQTTLASTNSAVCSDTVPVPRERSGETLPTEDVARLFGNIWRLISESLPLPACTTRARPLIPIGGTDH